MSKKRTADNQTSKYSAELAEEASIDELEFEDPYGDDVEDEDDDYRESDPADGIEEERSGKKVAATTSLSETKQVWRPGVDKIEDGEELDYDPSAYIMYHSLQTEWPCLSFDFLRDELGDSRVRFPLTLFMATGSQADRPEKNKITLLKLSDLHKTYIKPEKDDDNADEDDDEDDDDDALDEDPVIEHVNINHYGAVNRIRSMPQNPGIIATMADTSSVNIFDLSATVASLMSKAGPRPQANVPSKPTFAYNGHAEEGYAIDWNPVVPGRLVTGDCAGQIRLWHPAVDASAGSAAVTNNNNNTNSSNSNSNSNNNGFSCTWQVDQTPYSGHTGSVEDLQWSPSEATVFASASADKSIRIWDIRDNTKAQITFDAHTDDVNVISWNKNVGYLLASGCDDGSFKVWDLRTIRKGCTPLAHFTYHRSPITSIEWAPNDESVLSLTSEDNQLTVWDLSVEADDPAPSSTAAAVVSPPTAPGVTGTGSNEYPPQLLFIHQGQFNMKEVHFHPQIPGVLGSTAENGFNIFKPAITVSS